MRSRRGFVLVAALWLVVALSAVGLDAALRSQAQRLVAANQLDVTRSREAALAGSEYARARLSAALRDREEELRAEVARGSSMSVGSMTDAQVRAARITSRLAQEDPWQAPHELVPAGMALGQAEFVLELHDTGVWLNINQATDDMLHGFLTLGLGIDYAWAEQVTAAIIDWRDEDDLPRVNGAEREEYLAAGLAVLPSNRPFTRVDDVRHVMGVTPELFDAMRPYLTVTGSGRININAAPEAVLLAVPSFMPPTVAALLRYREGGLYARNFAELQAMLGGLFRAPTGQQLAAFTRRVTYATNEVEIRSLGRVEASPVTSEVRAIVGRANTGALLLWRSIE